MSVPNRRPWSDIPESTDGPDTLRQSTEAELVHGSCRGWAIIMPFEESAWTPTQLAPFIQRISSGQTIDGTVGLFTPLTCSVPCNWSSRGDQTKTYPFKVWSLVVYDRYGLLRVWSPSVTFSVPSLTKCKLLTVWLMFLGYYTGMRRYGSCLRVKITLCREWSCRTSEILFSPREDKISDLPCNALCIILTGVITLLGFNPSRHHTGDPSGVIHDALLRLIIVFLLFPFWALVVTKGNLIRLKILFI